LRDDFGPDSDVDVLVEFEPEARIGFLKFFEIENELEAIIGRKIDLVTPEGLKPLIRDDILTQAEVIYAA
ncbi:MAG: nucleotidyltransferase, partial [Gammaproteobacteria bacterium]|nr:nucleotidyltransferase [Gammaproteobacteria bacterium]